MYPFLIPLSFPTHQPAVPHQTESGECFEHTSPTKHMPKLPSIPFPVMDFIHAVS